MYKRVDGTTSSTWRSSSMEWKSIFWCLVCIFLLSAAQASRAASKYYYVHSDHVGTPQALTDENQTVVWRVESQTPFGVTDVNEDPDGDGNLVEFNLRFPGQYFDKETGFNYNWHRYYDPTLGRYLQSDPTGLSDGPNTYLYAQANPLMMVDPTGTTSLMACANPVNAIACAEAGIIQGAVSGASTGALFAGAENLAEQAMNDCPFDFGDLASSMAVGAAVGAVGGTIGGKAAGSLTRQKVTKGLASVPGRVQSRINLSNDGIAHTISRHLNPAKAGNKSQFTLSESELRTLLSAKSTIQAPATALETGNFARTITTNRTVGNLAEKMGGGSTNTFTVITDKFGNLQTAFPGGL